MQFDNMSMSHSSKQCQFNSQTVLMLSLHVSEKVCDRQLVILWFFYISLFGILCLVEPQ